MLVDPLVPATILGDATRIAQVLVNLISNALRFTAVNGRVDCTITSESTRRPLSPPPPPTFTIGSDTTSAAALTLSASELPNSISSRSGSAAVAAARDHRLRVEVQDHGIGIAPAALKRLFQPFTQADSSTTRKYGGTGLGLSICKQLVELMGGAIGVSSVLGVGSCFWFELPMEVPQVSTAATAATVAASPAATPSLPRAGHASESLRSASVADEEVAAGQWRTVAMLPAQQSSLPPPIPATSGGGSASWHALDEDAAAAIPLSESPGYRSPTGTSTAVAFQRASSSFEPPTIIVPPPSPRILLAEDNQVNVLVVVRMLQRLGYHDVTVAMDGGLAVQAVADTHMPFDLVLMDVQMPVCGGLEATRRIRALPDAARAAVPVVALSASVLEKDIAECLQAGMQSHLAKPVVAQALGAVVERWVRPADA